MPEETTGAYYRVRALAASNMADGAKDPLIRNIHLELARNYEMLAESADECRPILKIVEP